MIQLLRHFLTIVTQKLKPGWTFCIYNEQQQLIVGKIYKFEKKI